MSLGAVDIESGQHLFAEVCAPCHGLDGTGIEGIGVNLRTSTLVGGMTPRQLAEFFIRGVSLNNPFNTTDVKMPPRGGRSDLSDQDMLDIAVYLQSVNTAEESDEMRERVDAYMAWLERNEQEEIEATPEVGQEGLTGLALEGQTTYLRFCAVCHGPNGEGVESLGKGFRDDDFIPTLTDEELADFIMLGRDVDDPRNETGIEMLPYGGQPYLDDTQIEELVAYIRAINTMGEEKEPVPIEDEEPQQANAKAQQNGDTLASQAIEIIENTPPKCYACHLIGDRGNRNGPGPDLNGLKDHAADRVESLDAEAYVRESILDPGVFIVDECPRGPCVDVMVKTYDEKLSDEQLDVLVEYLLSLEAQ
jgi:mono/diheme cytochrome c family protein